MSYTIKQLSKLAGISVRTLHYYDEVGLLRPARRQKNDYRQYEEPELLKLQQILFFRELDFPILEIKRIMSLPDFDMVKALRQQKKFIELKQKRLIGLTRTIDQTIKKINIQITMEDKDLYVSLSKEEMDQYAKEAKERWGNTDAYKQSQEQVKKMTKVDFARIQKEGDDLMREIVLNMSKGPESKEVQALIERHYNNLRTFYEPNLEMYRGLAEMYVADPRFTAYYEKYVKGLVQFMRDAMVYYTDAQVKRNSV
jgi:MerR family transcriptional regulator, thiopeptide resistance regulator